MPSEYLKVSGVKAGFGAIAGGLGRQELEPPPRAARRERRGLRRRRAVVFAWAKTKEIGRREVDRGQTSRRNGGGGWEARIRKSSRQGKDKSKNLISKHHASRLQPPSRVCALSQRYPGRIAGGWGRLRDRRRGKARAAAASSCAGRTAAPFSGGRHRSRRRQAGASTEAQGRKQEGLIRAELSGTWFFQAADENSNDRHETSCMLYHE